MKAILIVDDNEADRAVVKKEVLRELPDLIFHEASTREDFFKHLDKIQPDLIICDFNVHGLDGFEIMDEANGLPGDIPVIIYTGVGSEELAVRTLKKGAMDYIIKSSVHSKDLGKRVRSALKAVELGKRDTILTRDETTASGEAGFYLDLMRRYMRPLWYEMLEDIDALQGKLNDISFETIRMQDMRKKVRRAMNLMDTAEKRALTMSEVGYFDLARAINEATIMLGSLHNDVRIEVERENIKGGINIRGNAMLVDLFLHVMDLIVRRRTDSDPRIVIRKNIDKEGYIDLLISGDFRQFSTEEREGLFLKREADDNPDNVQLILCRSIAEMFGGTLWYSPPGDDELDSEGFILQLREMVR
ncbi:MAG: response regulator [Thermoplasmata archaeon]|nr:response regulator [Thermoplasmata archaeon]